MVNKCTSLDKKHKTEEDGGFYSFMVNIRYTFKPKINTFKLFKAIRYNNTNKSQWINAKSFPAIMRKILSSMVFSCITPVITITLFDVK